MSALVVGIYGAGDCGRVLYVFGSAQAHIGHKDSGQQSEYLFLYIWELCSKYFSSMEADNRTPVSRLESGLTLASTEVVELDRLPHQSTGTDGNKLAIEDYAPRSTSRHTPHPPKGFYDWRGRLSQLCDKHPKIHRSYKWLRGPVPPVVLQPTALLDTATLRWRTRTIRFDWHLESRWSKSTTVFHRGWLLFPLAAAYIIGLAFISRTNSFLTPAESFVGCTSTYWLKDDGCGLNGESCSPFTGPDFQFRCPGDCLSVTLANPRAVGAEELVYTSLVVGGGDSNKTYRGDSWICAAAIQA